LCWVRHGHVADVRAAVRRPLVLLGLTDLFHTVTGWDAALAEEKATLRSVPAEDLR
jgi:hypothetical protein